MSAALFYLVMLAAIAALVIAPKEIMQMVLGGTWLLMLLWAVGSLLWLMVQSIF